MTPLPAKLSGLVEHYAGIQDRGERIEALIDLASAWRDVPPEVARRPFPETSKVPACESEAYVFARPRPDGGLEVDTRLLRELGLDTAPRSFPDLAGDDKGILAEDLEALAADLRTAALGGARIARQVRIAGSSRVLEVSCSARLVPTICASIIFSVRASR